MKIAITGSIGSGKSTVSDYIRSKGYEVFDCDRANAKLLEKGNLGYLEVKKAFPDAFTSDELSKAKLAEIIFNDKTKKQILENIMHPLILDEMNKQSFKRDLFIAEVPLLFEKDWDKYFDITLLVTTDDALAISRLINRGMSKTDAENRLKNQFPNELKIKRANEIIYNNGSLYSLYKKTDEILNKYVR